MATTKEKQPPLAAPHAELNENRIIHKLSLVSIVGNTVFVRL